MCSITTRQDDAPLLNDYFTAAAYPMTTKSERDAALFMMRHKWVAALSHPHLARRLKPSHARGYVRRQEYYVRDAMNTVDDLPVTPMAWSPFWPPIWSLE
jgi:hypothetical protein